MAKSKSTSKFTELFSDIKENITEGARSLGKMSGELLEEAKEKAEELYEAGTEKFEQASGVIHDYVDRHKSNQEIKRLTSEKLELNSRFGDAVYHEYRKNGTVAKRFLTTKKMATLLGEIEQVDKEILRIGKELDKSNKK